jgi:UDP-N-acetylglucosamine diphosphorylase / glucose-1-phosphate thymidylyltransferase / UDP-N-acetylgalactosamine diphosphorylase / glucosamine-1-phosphate N-acetyltransferase / galactosamine-1-phosphate N-acetyltransferase
VNLYDFVPSLFEVVDSSHHSIPPWELAANVETIISTESLRLNENEYKQQGNLWIHHSVLIEENVQIRSAAIIGAGCFIASNTYIRGGVILGANTYVGPGVELKSVICCGDSAFAQSSLVCHSSNK